MDHITLIAAFPNCLVGPGGWAALRANVSEQGGRSSQSFHGAASSRCVDTMLE